MRIGNLLLIMAFIMALAVTTASGQAIQSIYTDLNKNCKTLERDDEAAGYILEQCQGVAGYKILVANGDDRANIEIVKPDGSKHDLNFGQIGGAGFSSVGAKAEWRVKREKGKIVPIAIIIRFDLVTDASNPGKTTSYLVVSKITPQKICRIVQVEPGPKANEEARRVADSSAGTPCIDPI